MKTSRFSIDCVINVQNHKRLLSYGATTLLAAGIFTATPVLAADGKDYPGGLCKPLTSASSYRIEPSEGGMSNTNATLVGFFCPGINDEGGDLKGQVSVVDLHPEQNVNCALRSRTRTGGVLGSSSRSTSGFNSAVQTLNFSTVVPSQGNSYFYYVCDVPAQHANGTSRIVSYELNEQ